MSPPTGVVLMTYGAPRDRADLPRYLAAVRGGRPASDDLVAEMARRYERIGGSPLVSRTREQAEALGRELGAGWRVTAGMRYSEPTIADAAASLVRDGAQRLVGIVMSPQWSGLLMGGYERSLAAAAGALGVEAVTIREWHRESAFLDATASLVREGLAELGPTVPVILTAHSLPRRVFEGETAYLRQLRETAELVAERAGLDRGRWRWAYQSAGHTAEEWLRPDLKELFPALAAEGQREVLIVPIQFLADHLEVLYDLDIAAAAEAQAAGLRYRRIRMPNADPRFIRALASVARRAAERPQMAADRVGT